MRASTIVDFGPSISQGHSSAVSLHAHSCCSRELLSFLPRFMANVPVAARVVAYQANRYRQYYGRDLDFTRTYWRPPMTPRALIDSEMRHIVTHLGLRPIVSVTDHDTIEAHDSLATAPLPCEAPISFEWTVHWGPSSLHIGLHNLPADHAAAIARACAEVTRRRDDPLMAEVLEWMQELPGTLVVLNHPLWDGAGEGGQQRHVLSGWLSQYGHFLDALEINGYRPWPENQDVAALAQRRRLPLVGGGDRHGRTPNAVLNVTASRTFADFAAEVRRDGRSRVLLMPEYREHRVSRTLEAVSEVLGTDPSLAFGARWVHRVFHVTEDRGDLPVARYWTRGEPLWLRLAIGLVCASGAPVLRFARRLALSVAPGGAR